MSYKMMKVFEPHYGNMPETVKSIFFSLQEGKGNDCYVSHEVMSETYNEETYNEEDISGFETLEKNPEYSILDAWLIEQGARVGEIVIIRHWW